MKERWREMLEYQQKVQAMTDLKRAYALVHSDPEHIEAALAAARREGAEEEAMKWRAERHTWEKAELEAFISGRKAGKHEAALEDKYGSFDAKVQAQIADAERRGAEEMRERAAQTARIACLVPPDGGSPTEEERLVCEEAARRIRALPLTPEEPT